MISDKFLAVSGFLLVSMCTSEADITFTGSGTQSETVTATLTDPDVINTGTGSKSSAAGTDSGTVNQSANAESEGDSAGAVTAFNTQLTITSGESFQYEGSALIQSQLTSQSSYSASADTADSTTITFVPDEALSLTATLGGGLSTTQGTSRSVSLFDSTTSQLVFDLTSNGSSSVTLIGGDTYQFTASADAQFNTSDNSGAAPVTYVANGNFMFDVDAEASPVPEPSTFSLFFLSLIGIGLWRLRYAKAAKTTASPLA